ncbi:MAG: hypothetical protein PV344_09350, partial [Anaplasma sp.]|nr:hypothetical protein [Anaplasma sp.]
YSDERDKNALEFTPNSFFFKARQLPFNTSQPGAQGAKARAAEPSDPGFKSSPLPVSIWMSISYRHTFVYHYHVMHVQYLRIALVLHC